MEEVNIIYHCVKLIRSSTKATATWTGPGKIVETGPGEKINLKG